MTSASATDFADAAARRYTAAEHEALRTVALAAAVAGAAEARRLARAYAELCVATFSAAVPLSWPRRTAGPRLRIVTLLPMHATDGARRAIAALMAPSAVSCELQFASVGSRAPEVVAMLGVVAAQVPELPRAPGADVAKALVNRDPDVLIDMTGLSAATGPFLAHRATRETWAVPTAPGSHVPPLVDRIIDPDDIFAAVTSLATVIASKAQCPVPAATLAAWWEAAVRAHQRGDKSAAREGYARVLEVQPDYAPAHYLLGVLAREAGDVAAARRAFDSALEAAPGYLDARVAAARAATQLRDFETAVAICHDGLARTPAKVDLWRALGLAQLGRQDGEAAAAAFERALALEPGDSDAHYNLGVALQMTPLPTATRAYRQALAFAPRLAAGSDERIVQAEVNDAAAIAAYQATLNADPRHAAAYKNLGEVLFSAGRFDAWRENFQRFETNCPHSLALAVQALQVLQAQGDFEGVSRYLEGLNRSEFDADDDMDLVDGLEELLYLLLFFDVEPSLPYRLARAYDASARRVYGEPMPRLAARRPGRLRIGYLSADLRNHVMGKMMWQALQHHDRSRFDVGFYSLSDIADDWTARFRGFGDRFTQVGGLAERDAAQRIAADDLDVLVDLSTHTKGAKPGILALKPARVQITHVASAGTVGLSAIDFKLTDHYADIPANQTFQIETMLPMAGCVYPFRHVPPATAHPFRRDRLGIPGDAIVIGAFVTWLKLSRRCLALWREVLESLPRACLALSPANPVQRDLYRRIAGAAGIAQERLVFVPQGRTDEENQARYELVDFVLDPLPFGGVNGTLESLDMGVPVVTLVGLRHGERTSFSILSNLGVTTTVANSGREYVEIAVRLATDSGFMNGVRSAIRNGIAASTLTDTPRHTRALEAAYEGALRLKCPEALAR